MRLLLNFWTRISLIIACISSTYLYLYPIWSGCAFPSSHDTTSVGFRDTLTQHFRGEQLESHTIPTLAPFRLLVLADPQLEGDSSLPDPHDGFVHRIKDHWNRVSQAKITDIPKETASALHLILTRDVPEELQALRKRIDLFGNDYYLAHIFRTLHWWSKPTHVTVLGDLIGSQWVSDGEFEWRGWRYWNRVFAGGRKVEEQIMTLHTTDQAKTAVLAMDDPEWKKRIINIAGNHDIGYAGDITRERMSRFDQTFGRPNWDIRFRYPDTLTTHQSSVIPTLHLIVFNDLNLDTPTLDTDLQSESYEYLNSVISDRQTSAEDTTSFTLLLTHVPLHKPEGICVDAPFFDFYDDDDGGGAYLPRGLKEQNHLSDHISRTGILQSLFGMGGDIDAAAEGKGRNGLILTGHDHEGCDTFHYIPANFTGRSSGIQHSSNPEFQDGDRPTFETQWEATRYPSARSQRLPNHHTGIREVTLRSMMGSYGGNAGLLSLWFDFDDMQWKHAIRMCPLGVQHVWWAIHVVDLIALISVVLSIVLKFVDWRSSGTVRHRNGRTRNHAQVKVRKIE